MIHAVQAKGWPGDVQRVSQQMEQGFQRVWLVTFRADHGSACQALDQNVPDSQDPARLVHALQRRNCMNIVH